MRTRSLGKDPRITEANQRPRNPHTTNSRAIVKTPGKNNSKIVKDARKMMAFTNTSPVNAALFAKTVVFSRKYLTLRKMCSSTIVASTAPLVKNICI